MVGPWYIVHTHTYLRIWHLSAVCLFVCLVGANQRVLLDPTLSSGCCTCNRHRTTYHSHKNNRIIRSSCVTTALQLSVAWLLVLFVHASPKQHSACVFSRGWSMFNSYLRTYLLNAWVVVAMSLFAWFFFFTKTVLKAVVSIPPSSHSLFSHLTQTLGNEYNFL